MINLQLKETVWFEWLFSSCRCSSHPRHHPPRRCWACWSAGRTQTRRSAWRQSPWRETCSGAAGRESLPRHRTDRGDRCRCRRCYTHRPAELRTEPRVTVCQIKSQMDLKGPLNQMTADCWGFQIIELFLLKLLTALWDDAEKQGHTFWKKVQQIWKNITCMSEFYLSFGSVDLFSIKYWLAKIKEIPKQIHP